MPCGAVRSFCCRHFGCPQRRHQESLAVDEAPVLRLVPSESNPGGSASQPRRPETTRRRSAAAAQADEPPPAAAEPAQPPPAPPPESSVDPVGGETTSGVRSPEPPAGSPPPVMPSDWQRQLALAVDFWRRPHTGASEVGDFFIDTGITENVLVP